VAIVIVIGGLFYWMQSLPANLKPLTLIGAADVEMNDSCEIRHDTKNR